MYIGTTVSEKVSTTSHRFVMAHHSHHHHGDPVIHQGATDRYCQFYMRQAGGELNHFSAGSQYGSGLGSIFSTMARYVLPVLKTGLKTVGKRVFQSAKKRTLSAGLKIANDVLAGQSLGESLKARSQEGLQQLGRDIILPSRKQRKRKPTRKAESRGKKRRKNAHNFQEAY